MADVGVNDARLGASDEHDEQDDTRARQLMWEAVLELERLLARIQLLIRR